MNRLFRRADPDMTEERKVRFLMRGINEELFAGLVRNPPRTVTEFITEGSTIEKALDLRARQYNRPAHLLPATHVGVAPGNPETLRDTIRAVVREELRKLFRVTTAPQVSSFSDVVREAIQQALGTPQRQPQQITPPRQSVDYAAAVRRPPRPPSPRKERFTPAPHRNTRPHGLPSWRIQRQDSPTYGAHPTAAHCAITAAKPGMCTGIAHTDD